MNLKEFSYIETQIIKDAQSNIKSENYLEAIKKLEKIQNIDKSSEVSLMLSLVYLNTGNYENAIRILEKVKSNINYEIYKDAIIYYLGLSYALNDENEKAKNQLIQLKKVKTKYNSFCSESF